MLINIKKNILRFRDFQKRDFQEKARHQYNQFELMLKSLNARKYPTTDQRILDIGCGKFYPFTLMLNSMGNRVVGIDTLYIGINKPWIDRFWNIARYHGIMGLVEEIPLIPKYKKYYNALSRLSDFPLVKKGIEIKKMDAESLEFQDESFDIIVSFEVFEHLRNLKQVISEMFRVMKKGAIAYIDAGLFTAVSGGHHYNWKNTREVPPWDHLRQKKLPFTVYLNETTQSQYLELFKEKFTILDVVDHGKGEGSELLTPEIRNELVEYNEGELTKHGIVIIARKD